MTKHPLLLFIIATFCSAQNSPFPFRESFDALPSLPAGWITSSNKNPSGDFSVTSSTARSAPNSVSSTDATRPQFLVLPPFDLTGRTADSLEFFERRSSTHQARILVEAAIGSDTLFGIRISSDSLRFISSSSYVRRAFVVPETLSGRASVRVRIRIIADTAGTTGVYRLDDVRLTVKKNIDLGLSSLTVTPSAPLHRTAADVSVSIKNRAAAGIFSGSVRLFDSLTLITEQPFRADLGVNDSHQVTLRYPSVTAGRHPIRIELHCSGDEDTSNNTASTLLISGYGKRSMIINEIMYIPAAGMPEWIEFINPTADTIVAAGWRISDGGTTKAALTSSSPSILPGEYCVVTTDTSAFKEYYPAAVHLFQAAFSSLNNSGDAVVLFDQTLAVVDSLSYLASWGGAAGRSLERIDTAEGSTVRTNWRTSADTDGATPGRINSVTPKQYDAAVERITFIPNRPKAGEGFSAVITVRNAGRERITNALLRVSLDLDLDSIVTGNEVLRSAQLPAIERNDSVLFTMSIPRQPQGPCRIAAEVIDSTDDERTNDLLLFTVMIGARTGSIVINEIMAAPSGDIPEWIEGFNRTADTVRIDGWRVSDNGTTKALLAGGRMLIPPQELFVITTDTMQFRAAYPPTQLLFQAPFSGLNNTTPDAAVLYDDGNVVMDSIFYRPSWGVNSGASLQRYDTEEFGSDSANWRSAAPTPGEVNDIARKNIDAELHRVTSVRTSEGLTLQTTVRNIGREPITGAFVRMELAASIDGNLSFIPLPALAPHETSSVSFEWKTDRHGTARVTIRCVVPADERTGNDSAVISAAFPFSRQSIVINEIMYEPLSGDAEFVELQNRGPDTLDAEGWRLLDQPGSTGNRAEIILSDSTLPIPPNGFLVIASDSVFLSRYPESDRKRTVIHPSLSLSNSGEDLILCDLTGTEIDSVRYSPQWHLRGVPSAGRSLERINPGLPSNDGKNWSSSASRNGATPHSGNSIYTAAVSAHSSIKLAPNPFSPDNDGHEDFLSINYSLPAASSMVRIRIYDVTGRLIRRLVQNELSGPEGSVLWNGLDDDGRRVRIGMYIILLEALDNFGGTVRTMKDVAVAARRL